MMSCFLELRFLGFTVDYEHSDDKQTVILIAMGVAEKAQWIADIAQVKSILLLVSNFYDDVIVKLYI